MIERLVFESQEDWQKYRGKLFTSSEANRLMAEPTKKAKEAGQKLSDGAITYILEKIASFYDAPKPQYYSTEMQWGNENEPAAAFELCSELGLNVASEDVIYTSSGGMVFFCTEQYGGTPDLIFPKLKAIAEIKCPNSDTHLYYKAFLTAKNLQSELPKYYDQMQLNMHLTNSEMCYFYSFDPRLKGKLQSHKIEIKRNQERIDLIIEKIALAHELKKEIINKLNQN
jgi:hypothetical protein